MEPKLREEQLRNEQQNEQENGKWRDKGQLVLTQPISMHVSATELPLSFKLMLYLETFFFSQEDYIICDWCCLHLRLQSSITSVINFARTFSQCEIFSMQSQGFPLF